MANRSGIWCIYFAFDFFIDDKHWNQSDYLIWLARLRLGRATIKASASSMLTVRWVSVPEVLRKGVPPYEVLRDVELISVDEIGWDTEQKIEDTTCRFPCVWKSERVLRRSRACAHGSVTPSYTCLPKSGKNSPLSGASSPRTMAGTRWCVEINLSHLCISQGSLQLGVEIFDGCCLSRIFPAK